MQVVVFGKLFKEKDIPYVQELFDILHEEGINVYVFEKYLKQIEGHIKTKSDVGVFKGYLDFKIRKIDFVLTLGGDGTILEAVTEVRDSGIPILGINLGRLGFLASIEKSYIRESINLLQRGMYSMDERSLLHLESNIPLFGELSFLH